MNVFQRSLDRFPINKESDEIEIKVDDEIQVLDHVIIKIKDQQKKIALDSDNSSSSTLRIISFCAVVLAIPIYYFAAIGMGYSLDTWGIGIKPAFTEKCYDDRLLFFGQAFSGSIVLAGLFWIGLFITICFLQKSKN